MVVQALGFTTAVLRNVGQSLTPHHRLLPGRPALLTPPASQLLDHHLTVYPPFQMPIGPTVQAALSNIHDDRMRTSDAFNAANAALMTAQHATQHFVSQDGKVSMPGPVAGSRTCNLPAPPHMSNTYPTAFCVCAASGNLSTNASLLNLQLRNADQCQTIIIPLSSTACPFSRPLVSGSTGPPSFKA